MAKTLRARIAILIGVLILAVLAAFSTFLYVTLRLQMVQAIDDSLRLAAGQIAATVENENGTYRLAKGDADAVPLDKETDLLRLLAPNGQLLEQRNGVSVPLLAETLIPTGDGVWLTYQPGDDGQDNDVQDAIRLFTLPVILNSQTVAYVQVGRSLESTTETLGQLLLLLLFAVPVMVGVAMAGGYWLAGRVLAPIERIRTQAASISAADLGRRLGLDLPDDEVGRLARTFDAMLERLDESFRRQRRFASDASHELRTPLAVIRGEIDVTLERPRSPADYIEALKSIDGETARMTRLVSDLLLLARSDNAQLSLERETLDLAELLLILIEQMQPQAAAAGVHLQTVFSTTPLLISGDRDRLLQLFINLLDNTFAYASGSLVKIQGQKANSGVEIVIADTGPGIGPEHLPHIFERFYRTDAARNRESGGSGLGLSIAQEIVRAHGGEILVESEIKRGVTFTVWLPATGEKHSQ
ncbi:MAG: HAMP domain-containing protein [Caldilineaceae bacterium]|nr:HAMP domain-containing protein [Caldilineaceae bacterium]